MDEAWYILEYLPTSYKSKSEADYVNFLWNTFESNYKEKKYQFAFLAFHMLYMCFVYFKIWQIKTNKPDDFKKALVAFNKEVEKDLLTATSPFTLSKVPESNVFRFFKLVGCENDKIGCYTKMVRERNEIAHSNGNIFFNSKETIDEKISEILKLVEEIQKTTRPIIENCYTTFLFNSYDPEKREYIDLKDQIREELIHKNYLSQWDIEFCLYYYSKFPEEQDNVKFQEIEQTLLSEFSEFSVGTGKGSGL